MSDQQQSRGRSVRTILEGLVVVGLSGLVSLQWMTQRQLADSGATQARMEAQMEAMTDEIRSLRTQLADVPTISRDLARVQVRIEEHERRIGHLEDAGRPANIKGWTR